MRKTEIPREMIARPLVLVVDDDPGVIEALHALLAPRLEPLYRVEAAASGQEALEAIAAAARPEAHAPVALVISDEKMPGMTGTDLLIALRQDPANRNGGRIIVTAYAGLASAKRAINEAEVDRYYPKPWDAEGALLPAVGEILARFARKSGLDSLLLAAPAAEDEALDSVRQVRRSWWEYLTLAGEPFEEEEGGGGASVPSLDEPEDAGALHVLARRLSPREDRPAGCVRLRPAGDGGGAWLLDGLAFAPEEAGDELETLLLRTAVLAAASRGVRNLRTEAPLLRRAVYEAVGFEPAPTQATPAGFQAPSSVPMQLAMQIDPVAVTADVSPQAAGSTPAAESSRDVASSQPAGVARAGAGAAGRVTWKPFARRYVSESRLCACAQTGCPASDYAVPRRGYFCPLDLREGRVPPAFPVHGR